MGKEIERKFLVTGNQYKTLARGMKVEQGFLSIDIEHSVRIRLLEGKGFITIKGATQGMSRSEFEYEIPAPDARIMLDEMCIRPIIQKTRYRLSYEGFIWEVDEFSGENQGLVIAEIELRQEGQSFPIPPWVGQEVTSDFRFYNVNLVRDPFKNWEESL